MPISRCLSRCVFFLAVLLVPALLAAQAPVWQPLGPYGGTVVSLTADSSQPGVLYAAAGTAGVFKSTDRGASWRNVLVGNALGNVAVDPVRPSVVYAIAYPGVVWKSGDGGAHWGPIGRGLPAGPGLIQSVTVDPARRTRVYLASNAGVWRSLNGGATWQRANTGLPGITAPQVTALLAVRRPAGTAFAGNGQGLYRTTDGAASWTRLSQGLPSARVAALAASEADPQTIYVLFDGLGLYQTTNGGRSWRPVVGPPSGLQRITSLTAAPRSPSILYATLSDGQVLRSSNGARSWSVIGRLPGTFPVDLTPDPFAARILYAGLSSQNASGVLRSDDGGATWQRRNQGYTAQQTFTVSVAPNEPEQVWTATSDNQVFRSGNGGRRWVRTASPAAPLQVVPSTLAVASGSTAFAWTFMFSPFEILLWRTEDAGASWQPVSPPLSPAIAAFRLAPSEVSTIYTLESSTGPGGGADVSRSTDGGDSWETRAAGLGLDCGVGDLAVAPSTASVLYVTGAAAVPSTFCRNPAARVLRSRDGGATWTDASAGLPPGLIARASVDPNDPDLLYVGYGQSFSIPPLPPDGVWKSTDGGATWKRAGTELAGRSVEALLATSAPGRVYAVLAGAQIFRSEDGGESWENVSAGLLASRIYALAPSPSGPHRVYAATTTGVWLLEEGD